MTRGSQTGTPSRLADTHGKEMQICSKSMKMRGQIILVCVTMLASGGLPAQGQQPTKSGSPPVSAKPTQRGCIRDGVGRTPVRPIVAQDGMARMPMQRSSVPDTGSTGPCARDAGMDDAMMGAAGLIPPGIMVGQGGRWMVGYQVMVDRMDGSLVGTSGISDAAILGRFMATPTDMTMHMYMGMVMYAPTDRLTLVAMAPYIRKSMNHVMRDGTRFDERTSGLGDVELRGLYALYARTNLRHQLLLNAGVGLPTGSIDRTMTGMRLEYPMQLGAGTVALIPGLTYLGQTAPWGWGAEFIPTLRFGRNNIGYRLGNRYQPSIWGARQLTRWLSVSARGNADVRQNVRGADAALDIMDEPTKDPILQGGRRLDVQLGTSVHPAHGFLKGHEFFVHAEKPISQSLDGPQLQRRWVVRPGWQWEF